MVIAAAVDAFVLPSSAYLVDRPVPDHSVLVHDGLTPLLLVASTLLGGTSLAQT